MIDPLIAAFFGLLIGSFLNVCIYRLPRDMSVVTPRSHCPGCEKTISWYDNIPLLSYLLLRARCRNCGERIPMRYPVVELLTAVLFFWSVYARGWNVWGLKQCILAAIMVDLIFTDLEERILPDEFTLGGAVVGVGISFWAPPASGLSIFFVPAEWPMWAHGMFESAFGALVSAGLLWGVGTLYEKIRHREGLGLGDVKMLLTIGAFLGLPGALLTIFVSSLFGGIAGMAYIWLSKEEMTYELPFGTFLGMAAIAGGLFGDQIMAWYLG